MDCSISPILQTAVRQACTILYWRKAILYCIKLQYYHELEVHVTSPAFLCQQLLQSKVTTCTMTLNTETLLIVPSQVNFVGRKRKLCLRKQAFWRNWQGIACCVGFSHHLRAFWQKLVVKHSIWTSYAGWFLCRRSHCCGFGGSGIVRREQRCVLSGEPGESHDLARLLVRFRTLIASQLCIN